MNVGELRAALSDYPDDVPVYVRGKESGVDDADKLTAGQFTRDANEEWYCGQHNRCRVGQSGTPGLEIEGSNKLA